MFFLSGLWHGAAYTFICWGLFHALLFIPFSFLERIKVALPARRMLTFVCVFIGWIIFRSASMEVAFGYLGRMFTLGGFENIAALPSGLKAMAVAVMASALLLLAEYRTLPDGHATGCLRRLPCVARRCVYVIIAVAIVVFGGESETFIYFQF